MNIGNAIANARKQHKMSQKELASKTNLSRSYICDLEKGRYNPSVKTLAGIAVVLQIDLNFLQKNDGNTQRKAAHRAAERMAGND